MSAGVVFFEVVCFTGFTALVGTFSWLSYRARRVHPGLWLAIAMVSMSWLEAPYDNVMYAVFHPDFHRLPDWGPIGLTHGGLPVIAPPGYVLYFVLPAAVAVVLARWAVPRFGWPEAPALLGIGLGVGMLFDGLVETIQANTVELWTFARTTSGVTVFAETQGQVPVTCFLAMGTFMMVVAYLLGRRIDGQPVLDAWVSTRTRPGRGRTAATLGAYVLVAHVLYLATMLPHAITKLGDMLTVAGPEQPYPEFGPQPADDQAYGALGSVIIVVSLVATVVAIWFVVRRLEEGVHAAAGMDEAAVGRRPPHRTPAGVVGTAAGEVPGGGPAHRRDPA